MRATLRFLPKVDFFPFFRSWLKWSKEGFDPHSEHLETIGSQVEETIFRFRSGRGGDVSNFLMTLVLWRKVQSSSSSLIEVYN